MLNTVNIFSCALFRINIARADKFVLLFFGWGGILLKVSGWRCIWLGRCLVGYLARGIWLVVTEL